MLELSDPNEQTLGMVNRAHVERETQGLERMDEITYAVLGTSGGISIIPLDDFAALRVNTKAP